MERERAMDRFSLLPEECLSEILARTSPGDACRSAAVSRGVKSAADSDAVWIKFLPSDHAEIVSRAQSPVLFPTYKHLYLLLANGHVILDGGKLSFAIDRDGGKKCYMLGARELKITWGSSPEYWKWESVWGSRFSEVAILLKLERGNSGFGSLPIRVSFKSIGEMGDEDGDEMMVSTVYLKPIPSLPNPEINGKIPQERNGGWLEVELGEFIVHPDDSCQVVIRLFHLGVMKSGLIVEGIELRPKATA